MSPDIIRRFRHCPVFPLKTEVKATAVKLEGLITARKRDKEQEVSELGEFPPSLQHKTSLGQ